MHHRAASDFTTVTDCNSPSNSLLSCMMNQNLITKITTVTFSTLRALCLTLVTDTVTGSLHFTIAPMHNFRYLRFHKPAPTTDTVVSL